MLITQPCPLYNALLPNEVNWLKDVNVHTYSPRARILDLAWDFTYKDTFRTLDIFTSDLFNADVDVRVGGSVNLVDSLGENRHVWRRIKQLGYEPDKFRMQHLLHEWYFK